MIRGSDRALIVRVDTGTAELIPDPDLPDAWLLRLNGTAQSHVNLLDPTLIAFDYIRRFADVIDTVCPPGALDVLHLGGGAMTLPRCLTVMRPGSRQTVVELDRALAELVATRLPLDDADTALVVADAREALEQAEPESADVIVADIFTGAKVPPHVSTVEFAQAARRVLRPGGWYLANIMDVAPLTFARRQAATLREVFTEVAVVADAALLRGRGTGNLLLVGGDDPEGVRRLTRRIASDPTRARVEHGARLAEFVRTMRPRWDE